MTSTPIDLTVEIRSADGKTTEFYQTDEEHIRKVLKALTSPRLLTQPQLAVASEHDATVIPVREIDMILARTSGEAPLIFPLIFPAGLLDITEVGEGDAGHDCTGDNFDGESSVSPIVSQVEVHTRGGWKVNLRILASAGNLVHDQRHWFAHILKLPVVAFRLSEGGIGLINPNNLSRVSAHPKPDGVPEAALPLDLLPWTSTRSKGAGRFAEALC